MKPTEEGQQLRNRGFRESHELMINAAVRLIAAKGVEALSVAAVARETGINRTTVYYHFASREALLQAVKAWSSEQLARGFEATAGSQAERIDHVTRFSLEHPELIKLWIGDLLSPGRMADSYPLWDALVQGTRASLRPTRGGKQPDAEVFSLLLLISAFLGPLAFRNRVGPDAPPAEIIDRFRSEWQRILGLEGLLQTQ